MEEKIDSTEVELKWYVLRAFSGKEKKVKEYFENEIQNGSFGKYLTNVVLPVEKVAQLRNGKKVIKEHILTPGYVLVKAALVGDVATKLVNAQYVMGFLSDDQKLHTPTPIQESEAMRMMGVNEMVTEEEGIDKIFAVGEKVKIVDGPFNGFEGVIDDILNERKKLKVSITVFGRITPMELDFMQVEKENGEQ